MNNNEILKLALDHGFKLKPQPDGSVGLNPYVFEFARALLAAAPTPPAAGFSTEDLPLPEDTAIRAAHPLNTKDFKTYDEAVRLVSAKHSKFALVDLVNWLLSRIVTVQEDEPVAWMDRNGRVIAHRIRMTEDAQSIVSEQYNLPLYTRPANDDLRKAAREFTDYFNPDDDIERSLEQVMEFIQSHEDKLRAALEGE